MIIFIALVALGVNGSSVQALLPEDDRAELLMGEPRPIRSDEYAINTPISIASVEQGFPSEQWIGLTLTDQIAVSGTGPVEHWTTAFRPQNLGFLLLGESGGLAFSWWFPLLVGLLGCFAVLGSLTGRPVLAMLLSSVVVLSPYTGWWWSSNPALLLGYGAGIMTCLFWAWQIKNHWIAAFLALVAGCFSAAFALVLYPAWQIPIVIVIGLVMLGIVIDRRLPWRRIGWTMAVTCSVVGGILACWYIESQSAIRAVSETIYPGQRNAEPGTGSITSLLTAPLNYWLSGEAGASLFADPGEKPTNLSEVASVWISVPIWLLLTCGSVVLVWRRLRHRVSPDEAEQDGSVVWSLFAASVGSGLLFAWAFVPWPAWVGKLTLMDKVPPSRIPLAVAVAVIFQAVFASQLSHRPRVWRWPWLLGAVAATGLLAVVAWWRIPWDPSLVPPAFVWLSGALVGGGFALIASRRHQLIGALVVAALAVSSWFMINPLQRGLGAISDDPLVASLAELAADQPNLRVEVFGGYDSIALVRLAGLQSLSGTTIYPDSALMGELLPGRESEWNNYAQYLWTVEDPGTRASVSEIRGTLKELRVDPCDPVLLERADPGWLVFERTENDSAGREAAIDEASCFTRIAEVADDAGSEYLIYRRNEGGLVG